ncbi:hypothetical protein H4582DRAFT_1935181, partial [Lactarius indigo]
VRLRHSHFLALLSSTSSLSSTLPPSHFSPAACLNSNIILGYHHSLTFSFSSYASSYPSLMWHLRLPTSRGVPSAPATSSLLS